MKRIAVLGSTGSIGTQTLDIATRLPDAISIVGLAANNNVELLADQIRSTGATLACIGGPESNVGKVRALVAPHRVQLFHGLEGACALAAHPDVDLVVMSMAGAIGIAPTHAALSAGKNVALASKEVLVAAGEPTMRLAARCGAAILPIDSEHSALFQCLQGAQPGSVEKLLLTASGGPFRATPFEALQTVTPEDALKHPTWNMGGLVTINSATLMNKALEIIEAHWLFSIPVDNVDVVIHPQSIVHSMVQYRDGSVLAQMGLPDMRLPIQYALVYPERLDSGLPRLDLTACGPLTFEPPDEVKFPSLRLARRVAAIGGTAPAVMNAANETAVSLFLKRCIPFLGIMRIVEDIVEQHKPLPAEFNEILLADAWAREQTVHSAQNLFGSIGTG